MFTLTAWGLIFNLFGVGLIGFVLPEHTVAVISSTGPGARPVGRRGKLAWYGGWSLVLFGFGLQLLAQL